MKLSPEQKRRVDAFIYDEWVDEDDNEQRTTNNLKALLNEVQDPIEIDCMLRDFNWDCGIEGLDYILTHQKTDPSTKLRAFWMAGPGYFCQYENEADIGEYERGQWQAVQVLQKHALSSVGKSAQLKFNPKNDEENYDWTSQFKRDESKLAKVGQKSFYRIPPELYNEI
jgi:hypothetical protein